MTLREYLRLLARRFETAGVPSAHFDAEVLVMHALKLTRTDLVLRGEQVLSDSDLSMLDAVARRREAREPLQHLLGEVEWGDLTLGVSPAALIPRPETEVLLHLALRCIRDVPSPRVLDVGTGTGALALGVKDARPDATVLATDISTDALALARENAVRSHLDVTFVQGDLTCGLTGPFHLVVSNPPYLPDSDLEGAQPEVRFDPSVALYGGPDGLTITRRLVRQTADLLEPGGWLALELDPRNVHILASELTPRWHPTIEADLTGRERFLLARAVR